MIQTLLQPVVHEEEEMVMELLSVTESKDGKEMMYCCQFMVVESHLAFSMNLPAGRRRLAATGKNLRMKKEVRRINQDTERHKQ